MISDRLATEAPGLQLVTPLLLLHKQLGLLVVDLREPLCQDPTNMGWSLASDVLLLLIPVVC